MGYEKHLIGSTCEIAVGKNKVEVTVISHDEKKGYKVRYKKSGNETFVKDAGRLRLLDGKEKAEPKAKPSPAKENNGTKSARKPGCLDAAAHVLAQDPKKTMNAKEIFEAVKAAGLWDSDAATPWATISSAIGREIDKKGDLSRFRKDSSGQFGINTKKKPG